jgi:hypothetical protein
MQINKFLALPLAVGLMVLGSIGSANAQTAAPRVAIQLATGGLTSPLTPGISNAVMARLILDTTNSSEAVRISSLPFHLTLGGGAQAATLQNCRVYNEAAPTVGLTGTTTIAANLNAVQLENPLVLAANSVTTLALRCDVAQDLVAGGTYTFSMNTANLAATGVTSGAPAIVTIRGAAPVTPVTPVTPTPVVPGLPPTGAGPNGGDAGKNVAIILGSLAIAGFGAAYARRAPNKA